MKENIIMFMVLFSGFVCGFLLIAANDNMVIVKTSGEQQQVKVRQQNYLLVSCKKTICE